MTNNSSPKDNDTRAAASGEDRSDALSDFMTAEVVSSYTHESDEATKGTESPAISEARVVFIRNGGGRRSSNIL